jgi:urate oxidase
VPNVLVRSNYGKSQVRLVKLVKHAERHEVRELAVNVQLEGDYGPAHVLGDNAAVLPTDTMKNTVYVLAKLHDVDEPEEFARRLAEHFLKATAAATLATVEVVEHLWERLPVAGWPHPSTFTRGAAEKRVATARASRTQVVMESGWRDLLVLKTAGSGFSGFQRDRYTTLRETEDRLFATTISASWRYGDAFETSYASIRARVRQAMLEAFAEHESRSVQHTLYAMGEAALERAPEVVQVSLSLPNKHHLLADLSPFGFQNDNEIFVPTDEPYGLIEATVRRG